MCSSCFEWCFWLMSLQFRYSTRGTCHLLRIICNSFPFIIACSTLVSFLTFFHYFWFLFCCFYSIHTFSLPLPLPLPPSLPLPLPLPPSLPLPIPPHLPLPLPLTRILGLTLPSPLSLFSFPSSSFLSPSFSSSFSSTFFLPILLKVILQRWRLQLRNGRTITARFLYILAWQIWVDESHRLEEERGRKGEI